MNRRGQSWSIDVVLAVVIFGFIAVSITSFALLDQPEVDTLQQNAQVVDARLDQALAGCDPVIEGDEINLSSAECIFAQNYTDIADDFNVRQDFCMYFEDEDGKIIQIAGKNGQGSEEITIGGVPCGQTSS